MKIKELKEKIKNIPDDFEVILSMDQEGNGFHYLSDVETKEKFVQFDSEYTPEVIHPDDYEEYLNNDDEKLQDCVVLWP